MNMSLFLTPDCCGLVSVFLSSGTPLLRADESFFCIWHRLVVAVRAVAFTLANAPDGARSSQLGEGLGSYGTLDVLFLELVHDLSRGHGVLGLGR